MTALVPIVLECIPVVSSREWFDALMQADNGDWLWICQLQTTDSTVPGYANPADPLHVYFVVNNLTRGTSKVVTVDTRFVKNHDEGSFTGSQGLGRNNQLTAPNGDVWIPAANNHLFKIPRNADTVVQLPQLQDHPPGHPELPHNNPVKRTPNDTAQYFYQFTKDGKKLITGTVSNWSSAMFQIDLETGLPDWCVHLDAPLAPSPAAQMSYMYPYYGAIDGDYIYIAGGKNPWNLFSIQRSTQVVKWITTRPATGNMAFMIRPEGIVVTMDTDLGKPDNLRTQFWLVDGDLSAVYINKVPPPFPPRDCTPYVNRYTNPPDVDDTGGAGILRWRDKGSTGPWTSQNFPVPNGQQMDNESLTILPDGRVMGNAVSYQGAWFYDPKTKTTAWAGVNSFPLSRGPRMIIDGILVAAGYPNGILWFLDTSKDIDLAAGNPVQHANFHTSEMKYAELFAYDPKTRRLFCAGRREREGYGTGIGSYDIATGIFPGGTDANMNLVNPAGLSWVDPFLVLAGAPSKDPAVPDPPADGQLIIFDRDLTELARQTPLPGCRSAGSLFFTGATGIVTGLVKTVGQETLYIHNVQTGVTISTKTLGLPVGPSWQDPTNGTAYAVVGGILYSIDLFTLVLTKVYDGPQIAAADLFVVTPDEIVLTTGPKLYVLER